MLASVERPQVRPARPDAAPPGWVLRLRPVTTRPLSVSWTLSQAPFSPMPDGEFQFWLPLAPADLLGYLSVARKRMAPLSLTIRCPTPDLAPVSAWADRHQVSWRHVIWPSSALPGDPPMALVGAPMAMAGPPVAVAGAPAAVYDPARPPFPRRHRAPSRRARLSAEADRESTRAERAAASWSSLTRSPPMFRGPRPGPATAPWRPVAAGPAERPAGQVVWQLERCAFPRLDRPWLLAVFDYATREFRGATLSPSAEFSALSLMRRAVREWGHPSLLLLDEAGREDGALCTWAESAGIRLAAAPTARSTLGPHAAPRAARPSPGRPPVQRP